MKYRKDFVTNSSSSSFVCEVCGRTEGGYGDLTDYDMVECENWHIFCSDHITTDYLTEEVKYKCGIDSSYTKQDSIIALLDCYHGGLPKCACPICNFETYSVNDMKLFLQKEYNVPEEEAMEDVKKYNPRRRKLYDEEYNSYVARKFDLNLAQIQGTWAARFGKYSNFKSYIK